MQKAKLKNIEFLYFNVSILIFEFTEVMSG